MELETEFVSLSVAPPELALAPEMNVALAASSPPAVAAVAAAVPVTPADADEMRESECESDSECDQEDAIVTFDESLWAIIESVAKNDVSREMRDSVAWHDLCFAIENPVRVEMAMGHIGFAYDRLLAGMGPSDEAFEDDRIAEANVVEFIARLREICVMHDEIERVRMLEVAERLLMHSWITATPLDALV